MCQPLEASALCVLATNVCLSVFIGEAGASGVYASAVGSAEVVSNFHSLASHMQISYSNENLLYL